MKKFFILFLFCFLGYAKGEDMKEPVAKKIPQKLEMHGDLRIDDYFWLKNRDSKDVIDYLKAENKYTEYKMSDIKLQNKLFKELKSRIKEEDESTPAKYKNYLYFRKFFKGKEYPVYYRKKVEGGKLEKLIDVNEIAKGKDFCHLTSVKISPDENLLAYAVDFNGRRFYDIHFKELKSGKVLEKKINSVTSNFVWSKDSKRIYYVKQDSETLRWDSLWVYDLENGENKKIYFESDPIFSVYVEKSNSEKYIFLAIQSTLTTEFRYIEDGFSKDLKIFRSREKGLEYSIEDGEDRFFILSNYNARNFKLSYVLKNEDISNKLLWKDITENRDNVLLENLEVFKNYLVLQERENALVNFRVMKRQDYSSDYIKFPDEAYSASIGDNLEYDTPYFRYNYESMVNPPSVYDYKFNDKKSFLIRQKTIPNYNPSDYETKREWITSRDGAKIPVSLVYKKKSKKDRLYLYGYGSYGYSMDADFNSTIFPLVDRDFVYAIVHVRGGSELGRKWYEDGRQLKKKNTFYDFIDATKELKAKYGASGYVFAEGGSAGGLLMGAIANLANELYTGIIAEVPFVDCLTTMLDDTIPLTTGEYDEWGNPNIKEYYDYIKSYSPYDNVEKKCYPNMLITSGYHDSQVQYWEPAKWTAKLRDYNTCKDRLILLKTDMSTGHSGKTGRFQYLKDIAFNYAFVLGLIK